MQSLEPRQDGAARRSRRTSRTRGLRAFRDERTTPLPVEPEEGLVAFPRMNQDLFRGFERMAIPFMNFVATRPTLKAAGTFHGRVFGRRVVRALTKNLWDLHGLEDLEDLDSPRGVILVSNHRSFFDMYVASAVLYERTRLLRQLYFPVRTDYFYTNPVGLLINLMVSGGAMWPPVFRDERKAELNPVGLDQLAWMLRSSGVTVGLHPEGTRNKDADPYSFLPPRPGVGRLVRLAPPETLVVPYYIRGLDNDIVAQIKANFARHPAERIEIEFGAPSLAGEVAKVGDPAQIAQWTIERIADLGERNRARRAAHDAA